MYFLDSKMAVISSNIQINSSYYEYIKIKNAIGVLNFAYFEKASIQIKHSLTKPGFITPTSMQSTLFSIYNKLIREHQIMFLLFNIFENALRSKAAILITEYFSTKGTDDWYIDKTKIDKDLKKPVETALIKLTNDGIPFSKIDTFSIFDSFTFGQLEHIYINYWFILKDVFKATTFNGYNLNTLTQLQFETKIERIRKARNDIAHHKPINYTGSSKRKTLIGEVELLLCYMNFNLKDALNNIDSSHDIIPHLKYQ
jgi:hypothetical protein